MENVGIQEFSGSERERGKEREKREKALVDKQVWDAFNETIERIED